jgi:hypothetical protein
MAGHISPLTGFLIVGGWVIFLVAAMKTERYLNRSSREIDEETGQSFHTANGEEPTGGRKSRRKGIKSRRKTLIKK